MDAATLAGHIRKLKPRCGSHIVVAIDGAAGSGKTTLGRGLAGELDATIVQMESIYPGWDGLDEAAVRLVRDVLEPFARGEDGSVRPWDWEQSCEGEPVAVTPTSIVIVEGVGAGAAAAAPFLSLLVWLEANAAVRRRRAIARDGDMFAPHWERWAAQEDAMFAREQTRERAELIIQTD